MHAGEERVDDAQGRRAPDASACHALSGTHVTLLGCRRLERPNDGRSDGDDAPLARLRPRDRHRGPLSDAKGLVEGKALIQRRIAGRGEAGAVCERRKAYAALPPGCLHVPAQRETRGGRLERDRIGGNSRPYVAQGQ